MRGILGPGTAAGKAQGFGMDGEKALGWAASLFFR